VLVVSPAARPAGAQSADVCASDHPVHLRLAGLLFIQTAAADGVAEDDGEVLFVVAVVLVEMQEHLGARGGGDPGADEAFYRGQALHQSRLLRGAGVVERSVDGYRLRFVSDVVCGGRGPRY